MAVSHPVGAEDQTCTLNHSSNLFFFFNFTLFIYLCLKCHGTHAETREQFLGVDSFPHKDWEIEPSSSGFKADAESSHRPPCSCYMGTRDWNSDPHACVHFTE